MMESSSWIDRLQSDEALTDNLDDDQARRLLGWGESRLGACRSDAEAERVIARVREINRRVGKGEEFDDLLAKLDAEDSPPASDGEPGRSAPERSPGCDLSASTNDPGENAPDGEPSPRNNQRPSHSA